MLCDRMPEELDKKEEGIGMNKGKRRKTKHESLKNGMADKTNDGLNAMLTHSVPDGIINGVLEDDNYKENDKFDDMSARFIPGVKSKDKNCQWVLV